MWHLLMENHPKPTKNQIHCGIRDRTMVLLAASVATRGDNTRSMLLSDLYTRHVPMVDIGLDVKALVSRQSSEHVQTSDKEISGPCRDVKPRKNQHDREN
jgi:hypothetical protein